MAARKCPQCLSDVSMGHVAAYTDKIECPGCKSTLEVSGISRHLGIWAGLLAGVLAWRLIPGGANSFAVPVAVAILSYAAISAFTTMFVADLRLRPPDPVVESSHGASHGGGHGGHH